MNPMKEYTVKQRCRIYRKAYNRMAERFNGGRSFGIDARTLRIVSPSWYATMRLLSRWIPEPLAE